MMNCLSNKNKDITTIIMKINRTNTRISSNLNRSSSKFTIHKAQGNFCLLIMFTCLILSCVMPLVFCQQSEQGEQDKPFRNGELIFERDGRIHFARHDRRTRLLVNESPLRVKGRNLLQRRQKEDLQNPLKGNHNKHKKFNRNHNKYNKDTSKDNQDNAKRTHLNYVESEKKYFDYFPVEAGQNNPVRLKDEDAEVVFIVKDPKYHLIEKVLKSHINETLLPSSIANSEHEKSSGRRAKRNAPKREAYISSNYDYIKNFVGTESNDGGFVPSISVPNNVINQQADQYYSQGTINDPWNNRFTQPNSYYLPVPVPPFIQASVSHKKHPIAGIYYNAVSPGGGHPVLRPKKINRQETPSFGIANRGDIGGEEEDRVVWEIKYVGGAGGSSSSGRLPSTAQQSPGGFGGGAQASPVLPPPTTRAPQPSRSPPSSATRAPQPSRSPAPPLIHSEKRDQRTLSSSQSSQTFTNRNALSQGPTTRPPPPPVIRGPPIRPASPQPMPSRCVWGIVSCCSRNNLQIRYSCFEQLGCVGAFWDYNPCADNYQDAAIKDADVFFS